MTDDGFKRTAGQLVDAFWSAGVSNPLEILDQVSFLLYLRELDQVQKAWERGADLGEGSLDKPVFTESERHLRWGELIRMTPPRLYATLADEMLPLLRRHGTGGMPYSHHLEDARFAVPTPNLLARSVDLIEAALSGTDTAAVGLYECLLERMTVADRYRFFTTPRHLAALMAEMTAPGADDTVCDPACGLGEFLAAAAQHVEPLLPQDLAQRPTMGSAPRLCGFGSSPTMMRLSSLRLMLHGFASASVSRHDGLGAGTGTEAGRYSVVLATPPFGEQRDYQAVAPELLETVRTRRGEILHIALALQLLKPGGRAAILVPAGLLFGTSPAHVEIRRMLVDEHGLEAVVKLPSGIFQPYTGMSPAILYFTKNAGSSGDVWFYDLVADGWSLDGRRAPLLPEDKLGAIPERALDISDHAQNNLPDLLRRWTHRSGSERQRARSEQSFCVKRSEVAEQGYDLSLERYRALHEGQRSAQGGVRLGDFTDVFAGSVRKAQLSAEPDEDISDPRRRVLTPVLLSSTLPDVADLPCRTDEREPRHRLRQGDIVGRDLAGNRHWTALPHQYDGVQPGQGLVVVRITRELLPPEYVASYLASPAAERQLPKNSVIPRIRARGMGDVWIPRCDGDHSHIRAALDQLREGEREAERILNELRRMQTHIFESGTSAARLSRLDEAAAISSLTAQNLRQQNEPYKLFQETYPYAIARAVRKFRHAPSPAEQHEAAIQCVESLILSLGIMALALATDRGRQSLQPIDQWTQSVRQGGVSLGHWVAVIRAVAEDAREHGDPAAGLPAAAAGKKGGKGLLADLGGLVTLRNKIRHGAGPRTRAELERSLEQIEKLMHSSLSGCTFLARSRWVHTERLHWQPAAGSFSVSGLALMGDHPDFAPTSFQVTHPLADDSLYLVTPEEKPIPLTPFCLLSDCPDCLAPELYYPDRMTNTTAHLKSLDRGHQLESDTVQNSLRNWANF